MQLHKSKAQKLRYDIIGDTSFGYEIAANGAAIGNQLSRGVPQWMPSKKD